MSIKVLRQKRADLVKEAQAAFDLAAKEGRGLTEQEAARDDAISAELTALDADIGRVERQMERQRAQGVVVDDNAETDRRVAAEPRGDEKPFRTFGDQLRAVMLAGNPHVRDIDPRLQAFGMAAGPTGMSEGIASDGGFLVQTDFVDDLLTNTFTTGEIASRIRRIQVGPNSNGIRANGVDETNRANGSRWGGVQAFWTGEAALKKQSQPKFKRISMELDKLTGLYYATDELLQDTTALGSWMQQAFEAEMPFKVEDAIVNGTGAGMPLGFLNSGCTIAVAKEVNQAAATIVANNILKMWTRMPPSNRKNAVWIVNQEVEPQLFSLMLLVRNQANSDNVGAIAFPQVTYTPPGTNGNEYGMLMGRPVVPVEYAAPLGTAGDITLADLSQYLGIDKGAMKTDSSIHVRFIYDETCFRFVYRFNGQPIWSQPLIPYRGTATLSPFVTLASRT